MQRLKAITDADLGRLGEFLASDDAPKAMDVATLEGWLTALAIGPGLVLPSAWLPWVWDFEQGQEAVTFQSEQQANEVLSTLMGLSNRIIETFQQNPASFEPVFYRRVAWGAPEWCEGFLKATQLFDAEAWAALWAMDAFKAMGDADRTSLVTPFLRLGDIAGMEITDAECDAQRWVAAIVPALVGIHAYWAKHKKSPAGGPARPRDASHRRWAATIPARAVRAGNSNSAAVDRRPCIDPEQRHGRTSRETLRGLPRRPAEETGLADR